MRLIFVEGVSGVGKTTFARKLCDKLNELGRPVYCYLEGNIKNPVDFYCAAYFRQDEYAGLLAEYKQFAEDIKNNTIFAEDIRLVRYYNRETPLYAGPLLDTLIRHEFCRKPVRLIPISEYTRVYKLVWERFARSENARLDYLIFDGSLFHHPINDMLNNCNASDNQVIHHVNTLLETVSLLSPQVIYLKSDNVAARLQKARVSRRQAPPASERIQFWERRERIDLDVMRQLSVPYDIFDISTENWDEHMSAFIARLKN